MRKKKIDVVIKEENKPIEAEFVSSLPAVVVKPSVPEKKKPTRITLSTTNYYITTLLKKDPKEMVELLNKQTDALLAMTKEAAMQALEKANEGDVDALERYKSYIQASLIITSEKEKLAKFIPAEIDPNKQRYKAPELTQEEWEKLFKPGRAVQLADKPQVFTAPPNKSVN